MILIQKHWRIYRPNNALNGRRHPHVLEVNLIGIIKLEEQTLRNVHYHSRVTIQLSVDPVTERIVAISQTDTNLIFITNMPTHIRFLTDAGAEDGVITYHFEKFAMIVNSWSKL